MGDQLSVLDIAWFIYTHRLLLAGSPIARLHPHLHSRYERLLARPDFAKEVAMLRHSEEAIEEIKRGQQQAGKTLEMVAGF